MTLNIIDLGELPFITICSFIGHSTAKDLKTFGALAQTNSKIMGYVVSHLHPFSIMKPMGTPVRVNIKVLTADNQDKSFASDFHFGARNAIPFRDPSAKHVTLITFNYERNWTAELYMFKKRAGVIMYRTVEGLPHGWVAVFEHVGDVRNIAELMIAPGYKCPSSYVTVNWHTGTLFGIDADDPSCPSRQFEGLKSFTRKLDCKTTFIRKLAKYDKGVHTGLEMGYNAPVSVNPNRTIVPAYMCSRIGVVVPNSPMPSDPIRLVYYRDITRDMRYQESIMDDPRWIRSAVIDGLTQAGFPHDIIATIVGFVGGNCMVVTSSGYNPLSDYIDRYVDELTGSSKTLKTYRIDKYRR